VLNGATAATNVADQAKLDATAQAIAEKVVAKMGAAKGVTKQFFSTPATDIFSCDGFDTSGTIMGGKCCPDNLFSGGTTFSPSGTGTYCGVDINAVGGCATKKCPKPAGYCNDDSMCPSGQECSIFNYRCEPKSSGGGGGGGSCFAKESTTACLLASPAAECKHVLMADLVSGDLVLGRNGATTVLANQHKAVDTFAEILTFQTAGDTSVSMTPDHAVFADGALVAAAEVKVGSILSTGAVTRITKGEGSIINVVTSDGTIVADGVLAASNPYWIASLTVDAPLARAMVNAVLYAAGDIDSVAAGGRVVMGKLAACLVAVGLTAKALKAGKGSK